MFVIHLHIRSARVLYEHPSDRQIKYTSWEIPKQEDQFMKDNTSMLIRLLKIYTAG